MTYASKPTGVNLSRIQIGSLAEAAYVSSFVYSTGDEHCVIGKKRCGCAVPWRL
jgi:hypothetical protein